MDWVLVATALAAIPVWLVVNDLFWAVVLITLIELLEFGPTLRKTWLHPHSESMVFLSILIVRNGLIISALDQHTLTTVLFPAAASACRFLIAIMMLRRPIIAP